MMDTDAQLSTKVVGGIVAVIGMYSFLVHLWYLQTFLREITTWSLLVKVRVRVRVNKFAKLN
jgi:hypothetical protein